MPNINLPTIDFTINSGSNKQELQQILDTLTKYRKELNFLLMNLDIDNMPLVGGLMEDINGNYSVLNQTVEGVIIQVGNTEGDIANLTIQAGEIISSVSDNEGAISSIVQTVQGIQSTVLGHTTSIGSHTSQISQLSNEISSIVSFTDVTGNQIASLINQTATTIDILASKINLTGITTIYGTTSVNDKVIVNSGQVDVYVANTNVLRFYAGLLNSGSISNPSGNLITIANKTLIGSDLTVNGNLSVIGSHNIVAKFA